MANELEQKARELREIHGAIIRALAKIVTAPQTDEQFDAELIPRGFVMDQVVGIRAQLDRVSPIVAALQQAQQPGAQAVGEVVGTGIGSLSHVATLTRALPEGTKIYTAPPPLPEGVSEEDVEAAARGICARRVTPEVRSGSHPLRAQWRAYESDARAALESYLASLRATDVR
jgi:hypothetical protein